MERKAITDYFFGKKFADYAYITTIERDGKFITIFNIVKHGTFKVRNDTGNIVEISDTWDEAFLKHKEVASKCRT